MDSNSFEFVQDIIISIHANIRELRERRNFADSEEISYIEGKIQAYTEMLSMLRSSAQEFKIPYKDLGL